MATTAREILDQIDEFLTGSAIDGRERDKLWNVLTALRGPDDRNDQQGKDAATSIIRGKAFPKMLAEAKAEALRRGYTSPHQYLWGPQGQQVGEDSEAHQEVREARKASYSHFNEHIFAALRGLI